MKNEYIAHHGIKGQKWGVRRFQNRDGSLTPEGKKRYIDERGYLTKSGRERMYENHHEWVRKTNASRKLETASKSIAGIGMATTLGMLFSANPALAVLPLTTGVVAGSGSSIVSMILKSQGKKLIREFNELSDADLKEAYESITDEELLKQLREKGRL